MKKFITYVPMQTGTNLLKGRYVSLENKKLNMSKEVIFPVECIINGYSDHDEQIMLIALLEKGNVDCEDNLKLMQERISNVTDTKNIKVIIKKVYISPEETIENHLITFKNIISLLEDGDELFSCITFGTKPTPIIQMMALNFAYKNLKNVTIGVVAYGKVNREHNKPVSYFIYDITALFFMNNIVDTLSALNADDAFNKIEKILLLGEDDE